MSDHISALQAIAALIRELPDIVLLPADHPARAEWIARKDALLAEADR